MARWLAYPARATLIAAVAVLVPMVARAEMVTFDCSGDVTGKFTFDLSGGTGATYEDNRSVGLRDVEISSEAITFTQERSSEAKNELSTGISSLFRLDRNTNKITEDTYEYVEHKVSDSSRSTGQCKIVPTPPQH
ncbi:MAG: hypothetical protein ACREFC_07150 [Stellaceae bacterium]